NHFVAAADVERAKRDRQRVGPGADADRRRTATRVGEVRFERVEFWTENEPPAGDDSIDGGTNRRRVFAGRELQERNHWVARCVPIMRDPWAGEAARRASRFAAGAAAGVPCGSRGQPITPRRRWRS